MLKTLFLALPAISAVNLRTQVSNKAAERTKLDLLDLISQKQADYCSEEGDGIIATFDKFEAEWEENCIELHHL